MLKIDVFAPHHEFELKDRSTRFTTILGGVYTIFLYSISLMFGTWKLYQWSQNQIAPTVT